MITVMVETIWMMSILGEDVRFWATVGVASLIKYLFTTDKNKTIKEAIAGIVAGACAAFYGHDWFIRNFDSLEEADKSIVVIGLVLIGEHIVRALLVYTPAFLSRYSEKKAKSSEDKQ